MDQHTLGELLYESLSAFVRRRRKESLGCHPLGAAPGKSTVQHAVREFLQPAERHSSPHLHSCNFVDGKSCWLRFPGLRCVLALVADTQGFVSTRLEPFACSCCPLMRPGSENRSQIRMFSSTLPARLSRQVTRRRGSTRNTASAPQ